jgi:hypothetical protein
MAENLQGCENSGMSMEFNVVLDRELLPDRERWQAEIARSDLWTELGPDFDPGRSSGFQPMTFKGASTGFEFYLDEVNADDCPEGLVGYLPEHPRLAGFRFSGDMKELAAALAASSTLASVSDGWFYDPQSALVLDGPSAIEMARRELTEM